MALGIAPRVAASVLAGAGALAAPVAPEANAAPEAEQSELLFPLVGEVGLT